MRPIIALYFLLHVSVPVEAGIHEFGDGRVYSVGDWSVPADLILPSSRGQTEVEKKSAAVSRQDGDFTEHFHIESISSKSLSETLLTKACERYLVIGGKIAGISRNGPILEVRLSSIASSENDTTGLNSLLSKVSPSRDFAPGLDVTKIFGMDRFMPKMSSRPLGNLFVINKVSFEGGNLVLDLETATKRLLKLTLDSSLSAVAASENGTNVMLLRTGKIPSHLKHWSEPRETPIAGSSDGAKVLACLRSFPILDDDGVELAHGVAAVLAADGKFWIGPSKCKLVVFSDRILGITRGNSDKLLLYVSNMVLPIDSKSASVYESHLQAFDATLPTPGYSTPITINMSELFPGQSFSKESDVRMKSININPNGLEIKLATNNPLIDLVIVLDTGLTPRSASTIGQK